MQNAGEQKRDSLMLVNGLSKEGTKQDCRDWLCMGISVRDADGFFLMSLCANCRNMRLS